MLTISASHVMSNPKTLAAIEARRMRERSRAAEDRAQAERREEERRARAEAMRQFELDMAARRAALAAETAAAMAHLKMLGARIGRLEDCIGFLRDSGISAETVERIAAMRPDELTIAAARLQRPTLARILRRIARATGVSETDILSARRSRPLAFARQAFFYWAIRLTSASYPRVAAFCGGRDHTTVMHGVAAYVEKRAAMGRALRPVNRGITGAGR